MGTNDVRQAWSRVGDELSGLGLKLKLHAEQELRADRDDDDDDDDDAIEAAIERLTEAIDGTVDAVGNAAKDPAVRDDVKETGLRLVDALATTFTTAQREIESALAKKAGKTKESS